MIMVFIYLLIIGSQRVNNILEEYINTKEQPVNKIYIGISGKMGSGKSTLAKNIALALQSMSSETISLAKPIKDLQETIYKQLDLELPDVKDRPLLIALGGWGRGKYSSFWLDQAVKSMKKSKAEIVLCDDVRFENEARWFQEHGILFRIEGEQRGDNVDKHLCNNSTETALDKFEFENIINNNLSPHQSATIALSIIGSKLQILEGLNIKEA